MRRNRVIALQGLYLIHHMKRSGGHAVINWIVDNTPGAVFVNNEWPIDTILSGQHVLPNTVTYSAWLRKKRSMPHLARLGLDADRLFVSLEDHELHVRPFEHPAIQTIVILRHPLNLFASRIRKSATTSLHAYRVDDPKFVNRAVRIWKQHAQAALRSEDSGRPLLPIFYDAWLTSDGYRSKLASELGFIAVRDPFGKVATKGKGSSFGQTEVGTDDLLRRADFLDEAERQILDRIMGFPDMADLSDRVAAEVARLSADGPAEAQLSERAARGA